MATQSQKLAESLDVLRAIQETGIVAIKSTAITRTHRERLLQNGFIKEVYKGWYICTPPNETKGDSSSWYNSYWSFCSQLLADKYKRNWCISPEQSLLIHAGNWSVPQQLVVKSPEGANFKTAFPFDTSIFHIKSPLPDKSEIIEQEGIRILSLPATLVQVSENTFSRNTVDARTVLSMIHDASDLLALLLQNGKSVVAGRLAGAFRNIGKNNIADEILTTMLKAGYNVKEYDPFTDKLNIQLSSREPSPYSNRIRLMWHQMREVVIRNFPAALGLPKDKKAYMKKVAEMYITDAYHSLSIEKYKVSPELIERVRIGSWNIMDNEEDRKQKDAMAAKGYWEAFKAVEQSIKKVLDKKNAGEIVENDHRQWYMELFAPSVATGILKQSDLAGYRRHQVYISQSKHIPLNKEAIRDAMPTLFELLSKEEHAAVRAVLGHFIFVFIHPYMDGNGRMARFLMNVMLASGGYPWTVIPVGKRDDYMQSLEKASVNQDIKPFAKFIAHLVNQGIKGKPVAKI